MGRGGDEAGARVRAMRRRLYELAEGQGWVHHVGDLGSGELRTTPLDRPPAPLSRARRLSGLGQAIDPTVLGTPWYRLTSRRPYQTAPEGYLVAWNADVVLPFDDTIVWDVPRDHEGSAPLDAFLLERPQGLSTLTIALSAGAWAGATGHVEVIGNPYSVRVPIGPAFAAHTIDLLVPPGGPFDLQVTMVIERGVERLVFRSLTYGPTPPWVDPEPPTPD